MEGCVMDRFRDWLAWRLASAALCLATPRYRKMIDGAIRYGLAAAARDEAEGRRMPAPQLSPHWRQP
jgi:hypothetical protein